MRTELPAERLQRRLGAEGESDADGDGEPDTSVSRWLPDTTKSEGTAGWVAAVRADPGRAGSC
jgi:competence protein ComEA